MQHFLIILFLEIFIFNQNFSGFLQSTKNLFSLEDSFLLFSFVFLCEIFPIQLVSELLETTYFVPEVLNSCKNNELGLSWFICGKVIFKISTLIYLLGLLYYFCIKFFHFCAWWWLWKLQTL